jgi:hypothetical protein
MKGNCQAFYGTLFKGDEVGSKFKDLITNVITNCPKIGDQAHSLKLACGEFDVLVFGCLQKPPKTL